MTKVLKKQEPESPKNIGMSTPIVWLSLVVMLVLKVFFIIIISNQNYTNDKPDYKPQYRGWQVECCSINDNVTNIFHGF